MHERTMHERTIVHFQLSIHVAYACVFSGVA